MELFYRYSYRTKETEETLNTLLGKPYGLVRSLKMGGTGSQRFDVVEINKEIADIIASSSNPPYINLEMRPKGLMLHLKVRLDNWVLALPYHLLSLYSSDNQLRLFAEQWKIILIPHGEQPLKIKFVRRILEQKEALRSDFN